MRHRYVRLFVATAGVVAMAACSDDDDDDDTVDIADGTTTTTTVRGTTTTTVEELPPATTGPATTRPTTTAPPTDPPDPDVELPDEWEARADAPIPLTEVGAAAFDGELWVIGGITADAEISTAVQVYDPETDEWRAGPDLPEPLHHAPLVATDTNLVVLGGYQTLAFEPVADVWVLDDDAEGWVEGPSLPDPRGAGAAAWDGERIVYGGGVGASIADEVWAIDDIDDGEWSEIARLSVPREHLAAASDGDGAVWFLAGRQGGLDTNLGTVDLLVGDDLASLGEPLTPRGGVAAFHSDQYGACLAGGEEPESTFGEVECVDATGTMTELPSLSVPRHGLGAAAIGDVAYVALGGPEPMLAVSAALESLPLP